MLAATAPSRPAPAQTAVQCWPEAETVWDTQYVETESEECSMVMVPQQQCHTVHKRRPKRFSKKVNKGTAAIIDPSKYILKSSARQRSFWYFLPDDTKTCISVNLFIADVLQMVCNDGSSLGSVVQPRPNDNIKTRLGGLRRTASSDAVNFNK